MNMTPTQLAERRTRIGGSDVRKVVDGLWYDLWLEKTGRAEPEDLSWVLPVQIGIVTEPLNLTFFEHATDRPSRRTAVSPPTILRYTRDSFRPSERRSPPRS